MIRTTLTALALSISSAAAAHSFWLQPEDASLEPGEEAAIAFKIGDVGDEAEDWGLYWERIASFRLYGPDGVTDQQGAVRTTRAGATGGAAVAAPSQPGTYVLAFESNPSFSDLEGARFDRYVANDGLKAIAEHRAAMQAGEANGTELYARRAKTLLQVGEAATANVTEPIGQTLEIVPLANPFDLEAGDTLRVRVLWRGEPLEGATLAVARIGAEPAPMSLMTDAIGEAEVVLEAGPGYLLAVVWGVPAPNDARADYFTIFSSLTFAGPASEPEPATP